MADFSLDQLLMAFDIDLTPMKSAAADANRIIDELEAKWAGASNKGVAGQGAAAAKAATAQQSVKESVSQVVAETQRAVAATNDQTSAAKSVKEQLEAQRIAHQKNIDLIKEETEAERKKTVELRNQRLEALNEKAKEKGEKGEGEKGEGEGSLLGKGIKSFSKGALGGGLASDVMAGVIGGEAGIAIVDAAIEALEKLGDAFKEAVEDSSKLENVRQHFESLAKGAGVEMPEALEKLRVATNGEVEDLDLLRLGTVFLQSGFKATTGQMEEYTSAVVGLARGTGHTAQQAIRVLATAMETGRTQMLSSVLGINRYAFAMDRMGASSRGAAAGIASVQNMLSLAKSTVEAVGAPALTLDDHINRLKTSFHQMFEEFAAGIVGSSGVEDFGNTLDVISKKFEAFSEDLKPAGELLGAFLSIITEVLAPIGELAAAVLGLNNAVGQLNNSLGDDSKMSNWGKVVQGLARTIQTARYVWQGGASGGLDDQAYAARGVNDLQAEQRRAGEYNKNDPDEKMRQDRLGIVAGHKLNLAVDQGSIQSHGDTLMAFNKSAGEFLKGVNKDDQEFAVKLVDKLREQLKERTDTMRETMISMGTATAEEKPKPGLGESQPYTPPALTDVAGLSKIAAEELQRQILTDQQKLTQTKLSLAQQRALVEANYKAGIEDETAYNAKITALDKADQAARVEDIKLNTKAKISELQQQFSAATHDYDNAKTQRGTELEKAGNESTSDKELEQSKANIEANYAQQGVVYANKVKALQLAIKNAQIKGDNDVLNAQKEFDTKQIAEQEKLASILRQARQTALNDELADYKTQMAMRQEIADAQLQQGRINPAQYTSQKVTESIRLMQEQISVAQRTFANGPNNAETQATYTKTTTSAVSDAQKSITQTYSQETAKQLEYIQNVYGAQQKAIDAELKFNEQFGNRSAGGKTTGTLLSAQIDSLNGELQEYYKTFAKLNSDPSTQFGKQWEQVVDQTELAYTKLLQYKDQLAVAVSLAGPLGTIFSSIGTSLSSIFKTDLPLYYSRQIATAPNTNRGASTYQTVTNRRAEITAIGEALSTGAAQLGNQATNNQKIYDLAKGGKTVPPEVQQMMDLSVQIKTAINNATDPLIAASNSTAKMFDVVAEAASRAAEYLAALATGKGPASTSTSGSGAQGSFAAIALPPTALHATGTASPFLSAPEQIDTESQSISSNIDETAMPNYNANTKSGGKMSTTSVGAAANGMSMFAAKIQLAVSGITSFVTAITSAKTGLSGALAGGMSGASLGSGAQSAVKGAAAGGSDLASSISDSMGAAMPAIGAALGVVSGLIMGQKNAMVEKQLTQLKDTYEQMQEAYSSGNATLTQTISALQTLILQAQQAQANSKKGGSQFTSIINQYNQQMQQYLDQQQQLMIQLNQSALTLSLPQEGQDYSSYIGSLQAVITQYEAYMGAATTAAQTMQAQTYLQQSLGSYTEQWTETLNQDATTAVQNALQLNQLIQQRNQLLQQTAQNERNIMEQGVLTRQQTFAQSKAQQLAQTQYQANLQLDQLNQQIDLTQAQVSAAQQVFNLATTRVGLEAQLLQLQEAASTRSMQGVQALANLVNAMQTGVTNNGSAVSTQNNFITQLLAMLASGGNTSGVSINALTQLYNTYASSGLLAATGAGI